MLKRSIGGAAAAFCLWCLTGMYVVGQTVSPANTSITVGSTKAPSGTPKWQNGLLLMFDNGHYAPARVYGYDRAGQKVIDLPITVQGIGDIRVYDVAASATKTVAVSGDAGVSEYIAGVPAMKAFIAWISVQNEVIRIIDTYPYAAASLAFAADGTLWAFGRQVDPGALHSGPHPMLRHYDQNGVLLNELLSSADLHYDVGTPPAANSLFVVLPDRLGFYSPSANAWCEVSLSGQLIGQWTGLGAPNNIAVRGLAVTAQGQVYVYAPAGKKRQTPGIYVLNKGSNKWSQVDASGWKHFPILIGSDGDQFVFLQPSGGAAWASIQ